LAFLVSPSKSHSQHGGSTVAAPEGKLRQFQEVTATEGYAYNG
jgi:hypothetical protein